ncbi:Uncharacterised protein [Shigella flexneri]|nr:Uncharacterised protein [Shigella flexneri]
MVARPRPIGGITIAIERAVTGNTWSVVKLKATKPAALLIGPPRSIAVAAAIPIAYISAPFSPAAVSTVRIPPLIQPPKGVMT